MNKLKQIIQLKQQGYGTKRISFISGISRNVVKQYLKRLSELNIQSEDLLKFNAEDLQQLFQPYKHRQIPDPSRYLRLESLLPSLDKELRKRGMTLEKVYSIYIKKDPLGYLRTQFYKYIRDYRRCMTGISMHIEHKAGDKMYVDFTGEKLAIVDPDTGEETKVEVFVAILGCSQLTYVQATMDQSLYGFVECCKNALEYFGGVPALIVPDNLKAAVTKSSKYEAIINEVFAGFAEHYNTNVLPARPYKPKDKSLVEGAVKLVYQRIFTETDPKVFFSLALLNNAILVALEAHNNAPLRKAESRRELFESDKKSVLTPLPLLPYSPCYVKEYKVTKMGHVPIYEDKKYYSVPYNLISKRVKIVYNSVWVRIYHQDKVVAEHQRCYTRTAYITNKEHLASSHRFMTEWNPDYFIEKGNAVAPEVGAFLEKLMQSKGHPEQGYKACNGIVNLGRRVGKERIKNACSKALKLGVFNYHMVEDLLKKGIEKDDPEEEQIIRTTPNHKNVRGKSYYIKPENNLNNK